MTVTAPAPAAAAAAAAAAAPGDGGDDLAPARARSDARGGPAGARSASDGRGGSVLARVGAERREAHEPPEARGLRRDEVRMLVARPEPGGATSLAHARARDLTEHLRAGDVLVVNTSATLPAALPARRADGTRLRLHLSTPAVGGEGAASVAALPRLRVAPIGDDGAGAAAGALGTARVAASAGCTDRWVVELRRDEQRFGGGRAGEVLALPGSATATLLAPYLETHATPHDSRTAGTRLWLAAIDTAATTLRGYLDRHGAPIRYDHTRGEWPLRDYQTVFALHPGSAEMPSAGRPFTPELVTQLVARGVVIAPLTLHTGVSSLEAGEEPYPERFRVPATTARLVNAARAGGGRVIAVGTTVVRALETVALPFGHVEADAGWTRHVVTPQCGVRVVDGLLTGWHEPDASHLQMLEAIAGRSLIEDSYAAAVDAGYRWHEFGDVHLVLP